MVEYYKKLAFYDYIDTLKIDLSFFDKENEK